MLEEPKQPNRSQSFGNRLRSLFSDDEDEDEEQPQPTWQNNPIVPTLASMSHTSTGFIDPLLTSSAYHIHQAESALSQLKQIVSDPAGWKKTLKHKSGVVVYMCSHDKMPIFKGEAVIHGFSPQSVFYVVGMRRLWDELYDDGNLVENLNETTSLTYEVSKPALSLCSHGINKPRDMAMVEKIECGQDGSIYFASTSVETPRVPRIQGRFRAQIKLQGWVLQPIRGPSPATRVTYVIQENLKGWVPGFAKKSLARRPLVIALVNDYLQRKAERARMQRLRNDAVSPSTSTMTTSPTLPSLRMSHPSASGQTGRSGRRPSILLGDARPAERSTLSSQRSTSQQQRLNRMALVQPLPSLSSEERPSCKSSENSLSTSNSMDGIHPTTPVDIKKRQALVSSSLPTPPPSPLYPPHRHITQKVESVNLLKRLAASTEGWTHHSTRNGLTAYTLAVASRQLVRVDTVISGGWTPEHICSTVQCVGARKIWDEHFVDGGIIERFSQKDYLVRWRIQNQETTYSVHGITAIDTDPLSGSVYNVTTSVSDEQLQDEDVMDLGLWGWVFSKEDLTQQPQLHQKCHISLIVSNEADVARVLQRVQGLQNYMAQYGCPPYIRRVAGKVLRETLKEDATFQVAYTAKHEHKEEDRWWCTDIRVHPSCYPAGFDMTVLPRTGTRAELSSSWDTVRIYTTDATMEGQEITVSFSRRKHNTDSVVYTCNGSTIVTPSMQGRSPLPAPSPSPSSPPIGAAPAAAAATDQPRWRRSSVTNNTFRIPEGYKLLTPQQTNTILFLSDELTFNGQQLGILFLAMVLSYYMGKLACVC